MSLSSINTPVFEEARQRVIRKTIADGHSNHIRDCVHYLMALLLAGERLEEADRLLNRVLDAQGTTGDPHARVYGNFKWDLDDAFYKDYNAGPFVSMELAMIAMRHQERLKPETRKRLERALRLAIIGLQNRQADVAYTNISIITAAGWLGLAHYFDDAEEVRRATDNFYCWLRFTRAHGITEFNSPNYAIVNLWGLVVLRTFAREPSLIRDVEDTLEWFLQDYFLHYHQGSDNLAGANSRSYTFKTGRGIDAIAPLYYGPGAWGETAMMRFAGFPETPVRGVFDRVRPLLDPQPAPYVVETINGSVDTTTYLASEFSLGTKCGPFTHTQQIPMFVTYRTPHRRRTLYMTMSDRELSHGIHAFQRENRAVVVAGLEYVNREPGAEDLHVLMNVGHTEAMDGIYANGQAWDRRPVALNEADVLVVQVNRTLIGVRPLKTRPFQIETSRSPASVKSPCLLVVNEEGDLELRNYLILSDRPVRLAQEGLTTGVILELRETPQSTAEQLANDLRALQVDDQIALDDGGVQHRRVTVRDGGDVLFFSVPMFEPNLRLFVGNEARPIVRTFNDQPYRPEYLLKSEAHGIFRRLIS